MPLFQLNTPLNLENPNNNTNSTVFFFTDAVLGNLTDEGLENYLLQRDSVVEAASEPEAGETTHARKEINLGELISKWNFRLA